MAVDLAPDRFTVRVAAWSDRIDALRAVRRAVFIIEQSIPEELEWDEFDDVSLHAVAEDSSGTAIGCGRLLPDGHIGRMAVMSAWRGRGVGSALLVELAKLARAAGHSRAILNAQTRVMPFYAQHGFAAAGDEYMEAGIPHTTMARTLR